MFDPIQTVPARKRVLRLDEGGWALVFRKGTGFWGGAAQNFIDALAPDCPFCGRTADWSLRADRKLFDVNRIQFRCGICGGILSAPSADITGLSSLPVTTAGLIKTFAWHQIETFYLNIDSLGSSSCRFFKVGDSFTLAEFKQLLSERSQAVRANGPCAE